MKKLIVLVFLLASMSAGAQTYIKTNALYWVAGLPNAQIETRLAKHFTFQGEVNASFWTIDHKPMRGAQFITGFRYYPKEAFKGFYAGGDFSFDVYNASKWGHWNLPDGSFDIQHGIGYYFGITIGYQIPISKRFNMDFYAGGGWHLGKYWGETQYPDGHMEMYVPWNGSGEWIPYKIGVTFGYRLTSPKRMAARFENN